METYRRDFLSPRCSYDSLDRYVVRQSILAAIEAQLQLFHGTFLDIGCGDMPYEPIIMAPPSKAKRYIGLDLYGSGYGRPSIVWDGHTIPLRSNSIDCAMATEVFEHCPDPESVMYETLRVLKPGGMLFFTVPFLWPLHCVPNDQYRFTPFALERHLRRVGFDHVKLLSLGGWDKSLAQMLGLWVRRRPLSRTKRFVFSQLFLPIVRYMAKHDKPQHEFGDQTMFIGISGTAIKLSNGQEMRAPNES